MKLALSVVAALSCCLTGCGFAGYGAAVDPASAGERDLRITLWNPTEWIGATPRPVTARPGSLILIRGEVAYAEGIREVRVNDRPMSLERLPGEDRRVGFAGFIAAPAEGAMDVEIVAIGGDGAAEVRRFLVTPAAAGAREDLIAPLPDSHQRWAVVIGISDYLDPAIPDLEYADDDARAFADFLRSPASGVGGLPPANVRLLTDGEATGRNIRSALITFLRQSTSNDVIYIFLAGHGTTDIGRMEDVYFLAHDTDPEEVAATALPLELIGDALSDARAYQKVLLADISRSRWVQHEERRGMIPNPVNHALLEWLDVPGPGFVAFTASGENQPSREAARWGGGHGIFTYALLEGLGGAADADRDGVVTLGETIRFTRDRVRQETGSEQVPAMSRTTFDPAWPMAAVPER